MNKEELKKKLDETIAQIKLNSTDAKFADVLIANLLSYKGQSMIEPTEVHVETKDVIKDYDFNSYHFIRCKQCIIFRTGGFKVVVTPFMKSLYGHLTVLLDYKDKYETLNEEEVKVYDMLLSMAVTVLELPLITFNSDEFMTDVCTYIVQKENELFDKLLNEPLREETETDYEANAKFEEDVKFAEELKNSSEYEGK